MAIFTRTLWAAACSVGLVFLTYFAIAGFK